MWRRIFDEDNPVMRGLGVAGDLLILNALTVLCCLPVVTAGAALTALCGTLLRLVRGEGGRAAREYFRALRTSGRRSILLGLVFLAAALVLWVDYYAAAVSVPLLRIPVLAAALFVCAVGLYAFPLNARYDAPLFRTLKNAAALCVAFFPKTIVMLLFAVGLWSVCLRYMPALPVLLMFGLSLPAYVCALFCDRVFRHIEEENKEESA